MRQFQTEKNGIIYINDDDFQVVSELMLGAQMVERALAEMQKRDMVKAIGWTSPVIQELCVAYLVKFGGREGVNAIGKLGAMLYEQLIKIRDKTEEF